MTSKEILKASMLEILFEHRNKQYGAYELRKFYSNRLGVALAATMSFVFLLCYLLMPSGNGNSLQQVIKDAVVITDIDISPLDIPPPPAVKKPAKATASINNSEPVIVPNNQVKTPMPATEDLAKAAISNVTVDGPPETGVAHPPANVSAGGTEALVVKEEKPVEFHPIEKQPEFPGGQSAWIAFLNKWLNVPEGLEAGERKTVLVRFMVSEEGIVTNFQVVQSAGSAFDNEVLRVLKRMPKWKPAVQNNHQVATSFMQPVTFQSPEN